MDDPIRIDFLRRVSETPAIYRAEAESERRLARMLAFQMDESVRRAADFYTRFEQSIAIRDEVRELGELLVQATDLEHRPIPGFEKTCLSLHAAYGRREVLAALGRWTDDEHPPSNTGVERSKEEKWEAFFVTLDKSFGFEGRIAYHDVALAPDRFQWQTQRDCSTATEVGRRYLEAPSNGWRFLLFVQERKGEPFRALGPLTRCLQHHGTKPITIVWELQVPIPQALFQRYCPAR